MINVSLEKLGIGLILSQMSNMASEASHYKDSAVRLLRIFKNSVFDYYVSNVKLGEQSEPV